MSLAALRYEDFAMGKESEPSTPAHVQRLMDNIDDVRLLVKTHETIAGKGPGRKRDVEVLNKSAIVFLAAAWESFVEDLLAYALQALVEKGNDHKVFPEYVLQSVGSKHNGIKAWALAGSGWRDAMSDNMKAVLASTTGTFNTPKSVKIDELFKKVLGMESVSSAWKWHRTDSEAAMSRLDSYITLRGDIAHRVQVEKSVHKKTVLDFADLVLRLSTLTNNAVYAYVGERLGREWLDGGVVLEFVPRPKPKAKKASTAVEEVKALLKTNDDSD